MAETIQQPGIKESWSFLSFAQSHGKPMLTQPREFVNSHTNEKFISRSVAFVHPTEKETLEDGTVRNKTCFAAFSRNLGELTAQEIASRADKLNVVQYNNGNYCLCAQGENAWEAIDIKL